MVANHRSRAWAQAFRLSVLWALRQVLGVAAIVGSLALLLALTSTADNLARQFGWLVPATAIGIAAWLGASLLALYALTRLLALRRDRTLGLWLVLVLVYGIVTWAAGGLPAVPPPANWFATPAAAAERPLVISAGSLPPGWQPLPAVQVPPTATRVPTTPPTAVPSPTAIPTVAPPWGQTNSKADLWASPDPNAPRTGAVVEGEYLRILGSSPERYHVYFGGDRARRRPGEGWIDKPALAQSDWPQFVKVRDTAMLRAQPEASAAGLGMMTPGSYVEIIRGGPADWVQVFYVGNGRDGDPRLGWVAMSSLIPSDVSPQRISRFAVTAAALSRPPEIWLKVPYLSQLDGSPWAAANCGPTTVAMLLEAHGLRFPLADVRREVMSLQGTPNCSECGSFIEALAGAVELHGLRALSLSNDDGALRRWTMEDVRAAVRAGHPVLPQVMYRQLPGREDAPYWGDHYIVVTGILGDFFLYNDPIDDGPGYGRIISAEQLRRAMAASDFPMAAFATALP